MARLTTRRVAVSLLRLTVSVLAPLAAPLWVGWRYVLSLHQVYNTVCFGVVLAVCTITVMALWEFRDGRVSPSPRRVRQAAYLMVLMPVVAPVMFGYPLLAEEHRWAAVVIAGWFTGTAFTDILKRSRRTWWPHVRGHLPGRA